MQNSNCKNININYFATEALRHKVALSLKNLRDSLCFDDFVAAVSIPADSCSTCRKVLEAPKNVRRNPNRLKFTDITDEMLAIIKSSDQASYKEIIIKLDDLFNYLPTDASKINNLQLYLGSKGFGMNNSYDTWRHSAVQLERLLQNKTFLQNASEIKFENPITTAFGTSYTDVRIVRADQSIIEIETKAGMVFFENMAGSNFVKQSANSLLSVTKIEDYKVFLNLAKVAEFADPVKLKAAKKKVIDAWEKGGLLNNDKIFLKFKKFDTDITMTGILNNKSDLKNYLNSNNDWFLEIFQHNIN